MRVEARLAGGLYALNRFLLTVQNKRMPVAELDAAMRPDETSVAFTLGCPQESARRYMVLLENLEDVHEVGEANER